MLKGVMSRFFVEFFCLAVPKNFAGNPSLLCFGKFPVANKFMDEKGGVPRFSVENFCLAVPKNFAGESFGAVFRKISGSEKVYGEEGGGSIKNSFEFYLSHSAEKNS